MLSFTRVSVASLIGVLVAGSAAYGQQVISLHSGVIHYLEGRVLVDGNPVEKKISEFPALKANQELRTEEGRAEVLLTPGTFLRLSENSAMRMVSVALSDTKVEVLSGSALVESTELAKDNHLTLLYQGATMQLNKAGLYRVDSVPARFRVFEGEARVSTDSSALTLKGGKETALSGTLAANHFNAKDSDDLYRWSSRRSGYVAMANVSSAQTAFTNGLSSSYAGWNFNPYMGMYTYVPYSGVAYSPFGYAFWSPFDVGYAPGYYYGGGYPGALVGSSRLPLSSAVPRVTGGRLSSSAGGFGSARSSSFGGGSAAASSASSGGGFSSAGRVSGGASAGAAVGGGGMGGRRGR